MRQNSAHEAQRGGALRDVSTSYDTNWTLWSLTPTGVTSTFGTEKEKRCKRLTFILVPTSSFYFIFFFHRFSEDAIVAEETACELLLL